MFLSWQAVSLQLLDRPSTAGRPSGNQLIDLFVSGASLFGRAFGAIGELSKWLLALLAGVSLLALLFATLLFFTARGLQAGRTWARILGILLALVPMLLAFVTLASVRQPLPMTLAAITAAVALYILWTLALRYA